MTNTKGLLTLVGLLIGFVSHFFESLLKLQNSIALVQISVFILYSNQNYYVTQKVLFIETTTWQSFSACKADIISPKSDPQ